MRHIRIEDLLSRAEPDHAGRELAAIWTITALNLAVAAGILALRVWP